MRVDDLLKKGKVVLFGENNIESRPALSKLIMAGSGALLVSTLAFNMDYQSVTGHYDPSLKAHPDTIHGLSIEGLRANQGPESRVLNKRVENDNILVISANDSNLKYLLANVNEAYLPRYQWEDSSDSVSGLFKQGGLYLYDSLISPLHGTDSEERNFAYRSLKGDSGAHAYRLDEIDTDQRVCYIKNEHEFSVSEKRPIVISQQEQTAVVDFHELIHCMDQGDAHVWRQVDDALAVKPYSILQSEIIADLGASMLSAKLTGNWDTVRHSSIPFRQLRDQDTEHQTSVFLKLLTEEMPADHFRNLSEAEIFQAAEAFYADHHVIRHAIEQKDLYTLQEMYAKAVATNPITRWFNSNEDMRQKHRDELLAAVGPFAQPMIDEALQQHGHQELALYTNHLYYHQGIVPPKVEKALLQQAEDYQRLFGTGATDATLDDIQRRYSDTGSLDYAALASALSFELDTDAHARRDQNWQKLHAYHVGLTAEAEQIRANHAPSPLPGQQHQPEFDTSEQHAALARLLDKHHLPDQPAPELPGH